MRGSRSAGGLRGRRPAAGACDVSVGDGDFTSGWRRAARPTPGTRTYTVSPGGASSSSNGNGAIEVDARPRRDRSKVAGRADRQGLERRGGASELLTKIEIVEERASRTRAAARPARRRASCAAAPRSKYTVKVPGGRSPCTSRTTNGDDRADRHRRTPSSATRPTAASTARTSRGACRGHARPTAAST